MIDTTVVIIAATLLVVAFSLHVIYNNPYTYQSKFWTMLGLGAMAYMGFMAYERNVPSGWVRITRLFMLGIVNILSCFIVFTSQVQYARVNPLLINTVVLLDGFALVMMLVHAFEYLANKPNNLITDLKTVTASVTQATTGTPPPLARTTTVPPTPAQPPVQQLQLQPQPPLAQPPAQPLAQPPAMIAAAAPAVPARKRGAQARADTAPDAGELILEDADLLPGGNGGGGVGGEEIVYEGEEDLEEPFVMDADADADADADEYVYEEYYEDEGDLETGDEYEFEYSEGEEEEPLSGEESYEEEYYEDEQ